MAKTWAGVRSRVSLLRRLAVVFADPLRLKIVTELYMREMSPTSFFREFGGGSVSRVDRHFEKLAKHGWLRLVKTETGGKRFGGREHFYRATELAVFDTETWSQLPYSLRVAFSWKIFEQFAERVGEAMAAGTFDARPDRHFTWTPVILDQLGWTRLIAAVDALFESLLEEQADAKVRIAESGETPILTTVALAGFESPTRPSSSGEGQGHSGVGLPTVDSAEFVNSLMPFPVRLAKVFADEMCLKIVAEANLREISPTQFHREFGGDVAVSGIHRRFKTLRELGWLRRVGKKTGGRRRGAREYFYRATGPAIFDNESWLDVPDPVKSSYSWRIFKQFAEQVRGAVDAGTFDTRPDRHLSWSLLLLDRLGWEQVIAAVDALFEFVFEERGRAEIRIAETGEEPVLMTVALATFESPKDSTKAP
jgi:hypothetical protein